MVTIEVVSCPNCRKTNLRNKAIFQEGNLKYENLCNRLTQLYTQATV